MRYACKALRTVVNKAHTDDLINICYFCYSLRASFFFFFFRASLELPLIVMDGS